MLYLNVVLLASLLYVTSDAGFVDTLPKCSIKDDKCLISLYEGVLKKIGKTGIAELNMPPLDPIHVNNVSATVLDTVVVTLFDGLVDGISRCKFKTFHLDFKNQVGRQDTICDVTASGRVTFAGTSPALQSIIGILSVNSETKAKVHYENVKMHIDVPFTPFKKEDGETYLKLNFNNTYSFEIGKATFAAKNIYVGDQDISQVFVSFLNSNWKTVMDTFGKVFIDKSLEGYFDNVKYFFEYVPAKAYLTDLPSY